MMRKPKLLLLLLAAAAMSAGGASVTLLTAQVLRCWDVVCTIDSDGNMHCVETPKPCPQEVT